MKHEKTPADDIPVTTVMAFTGHRTLANPAVVKKSIDEIVEEFAARGRISGIASAALGSDTLFAQALASRELPFSLVLPFPLERFQADFPKETAKAWEDVLDLVKKAADIEVIESWARPVPASSEDEPTQDQVAYMDTAIRTMEEADVLIAVWDGKPAKGFGGTTYAVDYAKAIGLPLIIINPETGVVMREIVHPRIPDEPPPALPPRVPSAERQALQQIQIAADKEANASGPRSRTLIRWLLLLHLFASVAGFVQLIFQIEGRKGWALGAVEIVLLMVGLYLLSLRHHAHNRWLRLRMCDRLCASFDAVWDLRARVHCDVTRWIELPEDVKGDARNLSLLRHRDRSEPPPLHEVRARYERDRVVDQINHFGSKYAEAYHSSKIRRGMIRVFSVMAIVSSVWLSKRSFYSSERHALDHVLELLAISLPLAMTTISIVLISKETARRVARYHEMERMLERYRLRVRASNTWLSLGRAAARVESMLLVELFEWRSFVRFTRDLH